MKISRYVYTYPKKNNRSGVGYLLRIKNKNEEICQTFNNLHELRYFVQKNNLNVSIKFSNRLKAYCIERIVTGGTIKSVANSLTLSYAMVNEWYSKYYREINENGFKFILTLESKV